MNIRNILLGIAAVTLLTACSGGDYSPKPQAYLRIDLPQQEYSFVDTLPGFSFEVNRVAEIAVKKNTKRDLWIDINYPQWSGVVFLSHKHIVSPIDLRGQTDTSLRLLEKHYQFSSGVDEQGYEDTGNHVYGNTYRLHGNKVASTYQFWLTDSVSHFLRGSLYLNRTPNNDSLAPVLEYIQTDIEHLIETLRWK